MFIIAANWKMNGNSLFAQNYAAKLENFIAENRPLPEIIILPPAPLFSQLKGSFKLGGQNCHALEKGAFTGETSALLLKDMGCEYVLCGHSERREAGETSADVAAKAETAHGTGLKTIICVGEKDGEDFARVVFPQLDKSLPHCATKDNTVIAYEPVWAIGTGRTPTAEDIARCHEQIAEKTGLKVMYGGSVKPENTAEISAIKNVGGLLVGGASLDVDGFINIIQAAKR